MCGQFGQEGVTWGNKEWNAMLDPEATAIVFKSNPPNLRSYGLDVTLQVVMPAEEVATHFSEDPRLRLVLEFAQVWFKKQKQIWFHDPLAAVSLFHADICEMERGQTTVVLSDGQDNGRTLLKADPQGSQQVAVKVEPPRFFQAYLKPFQTAARR